MESSTTALIVLLLLCIGGIIAAVVSTSGSEEKKAAAPTQPASTTTGAAAKPAAASTTTAAAAKPSAAASTGWRARYLRLTNPTDFLRVLYMAAKNASGGVIRPVAGRVEPSAFRIENGPNPTDLSGASINDFWGDWRRALIDDTVFAHSDAPNAYIEYDFGEDVAVDRIEVRTAHVGNFKVQLRASNNTVLLEKDLPTNEQWFVAAASTQRTSVSISVNRYIHKCLERSVNLNILIHTNGNTAEDRVAALRSDITDWTPIPPKERGMPPGVPIPPAVVVVDGHHDALPPLWAATAADRRPATLLHFDSHPDLACMEPTTPQAVLARLAAGADDAVDAAHARCTIASWILPLVLAGRVAAVVWVSAWWCQQMDPGTYRLRVGLENGRMKVGAATDAGAGDADDDPEDACAPYWRSARCWAGARRLRRARPWTLHVVRLPAGADALVPADADRIRRAILGDGGNRPWLLDVDEDFFSCANPYAETFVALFGDADHACLREVYDPAEDAAAHWAALGDVVRRGLHRLPPADFARQPVVRRLAATVPPARLEDYRRLLDAVATAPDDPVGRGRRGRRWTAAHLFDAAAVHDAGEAAGLPHHVSPAPELVALLNATEGLLAALGAPPPACVTVATSRTDGYLPAAQAERIHAAACTLLARRYGVRLRDLDRRDAVPHAVPLRAADGRPRPARKQKRTDADAGPTPARPVPAPAGAAAPDTAGP